MKDNLIYARLLTGDNIVAEFISEDTVELVVGNPVSVITSMNMDGTLGTAFIPWNSVAQAEETRLKKFHVVAKLLPSKSVAKAYERYLKQRQADQEFAKLSDREKTIASYVQMMDQDNGNLLPN